jgi:hypothetical protein
VYLEKNRRLIGLCLEIVHGIKARGVGLTTCCSSAHYQIQPVPYLLHGINQLRSPQMPLVGQNQGVRQLCMHLSMHLAEQTIPFGAATIRDT